MIRLSYVLCVSFQVINRIMRCFQSINLETAPLTNNKRGIVRIISVGGYIFRISIVHEAKFTDEEFTIFSRHYFKKCNGLKLLNLWRLRPKSYPRLLTWPKTMVPWFKSSALPLCGFALGSPEFNSSTALCK